MKNEKYTKESYIKFPLYYFQEIWNVKSQEVFQKILEYGIIDYAEQTKKSDNLGSLKESFERTQKILGITDIDFKKAFKTWKKSESDKLTPTLRIEKIYEFRDQEKTKLEIAELTAFIACKSIIGNKRQFCKTNKEHIVSRMLGFGSKEEFNPEKLDEPQQEIRKKYNKRYWVEKLFDQLGGYWKIFYHSKNGLRGFYIGNGNRISLENFLTAIENSETDKAAQHKKKKENFLKKIRKNNNSENTKSQNSENHEDEEDDHDLP